MKIQISLRISAVWSESSLGAFRLAKNATFLHEDNEHSNQIAWMRRLIWVFTGRTYRKVRFLTLQIIWLCCMQRRASYWYWRTVGQGLLSLQPVMVEGECFYFFCFFTFIHFPFSLVSTFISSTISSISLLPFSGRRHKMIHKGWHGVKPQLN